MSKSIKYLGFDDRWLALMAIPVINIIICLMIFDHRFFLDNIITCTATCGIYTISYYFLIRFLIIEYHKRFPDYIFNIKRLTFVSIWLMVIYFGVKIILKPVMMFIAPVCVEAVQKNHIAEVISTGMMIMLMFFLYEGIYYFLKSRNTEIEKNKLEKISAEQRLDTLKNQVNPHFLFNSLNTVITMIPEEPNLAINFIQKLSKTYRNILEVRNEKLISIRQELKALDAYIFLLKTRFQGKIQIFNTLPEINYDDFILPLSLQILIENAVKHNVTSKSNPLKIEIKAEENLIVIRNNLQKKMQDYNSTKMGLANIRSRYKLLVNKEITVEESKEYFTVKLPIIRNMSL